MTTQPQKRPFTVGEYYRMAEADILTEEDRVELIAGQIVAMSPIGSRHAACVKRLNLLLGKMVGDSMLIGVQDPITLDAYSAPEPEPSAAPSPRRFLRGGPSVGSRCATSRRSLRCVGRLRPRGQACPSTLKLVFPKCG